ncbi:MAG: hypothetical protein WAN86_16695 [Hyphomicrobiaceae bacterium]
MGLTKMNCNSCNFNDGLPVTVRFANMVGEVLNVGSAKPETSASRSRHPENEHAIGVFSTGERIAVALVLNRMDLIPE